MSLTEQQINEYFMNHIHCSQIVLMEWAEALGYTKEEAARIAAPFGGGMFNGDTCGAVAGAMLAIGMKYGHSEPGDIEGDEKMREKVAEFNRRFTEAKGSTICRDLIGYDFGKPGDAEKAFESGVIFERCPGYVLEALKILDDIMKDD
ncbi:MAG TPA: C-GCAxxG-C-C family protein [Bacillota bacterium]|jgi:C_GCAxxG_C_C family probable redox protein|nr:C-GCAxxG-C-C family protein [Bacillota bacterium]HPZ59321.1 C-GCAxxG-C-C family protein [Bacillota bacterium]HQC81855.1 C-GCAxxG-C-C family protein [Bacillota bacterium]